MAYYNLALIVGVDLVGFKDKCTVGPELARVCTEAAHLLQQIRGSKLICTAGYSPRNQAYMSSAVDQCLQDELKVPRNLIIPPEAAVAIRFNTWGEMEVLARYLIRLAQADGDFRAEVHICCRDFHLPRAKAILENRLPPWLHQKVVIEGHPVTANAGWYEINIRERLAWVKFAIMALQHRWDKWYDCPSCSTQMSCQADAAMELVCQRCGFLSAEAEDDLAG